MPETCNAPTNPADNGAPINAAPIRVFYPLPDGRTEEIIGTIIEATKRELNVLCED